MLKAAFVEHEKQKVWELRQKDDEMACLRKETEELCRHFGGLLIEARTFITETHNTETYTGVDTGVEGQD